MSREREFGVRRTVRTSFDGLIQHYWVSYQFTLLARVPLPDQLAFMEYINESKRIFGLDLMRAIAILTVVYAHGQPIVIHEFPNYLAVNFDGVTLFFVLSGYLIGRILIRDFQTRGIQKNTLINFWLRRWLRTLPAYMVVLTILGVLAIVSTGNPPSNLYLYYLFSQNLAWEHPLFFAEAWSLSVEEWFYLMFPCLLLLATRFFRLSLSRAILTIIILIVVGTTLGRIFRLYMGDIETLGDWDTHLRKIVITRFDSLMFGVLGAHLSLFHPRRWLAYRGPLLILGICLLIIDQVMIKNVLWRNYVTLSLTPFAALLLLPLLSTWKQSPHRVFNFFTFISLISYSLYLVHLSLVENILLKPLIEKSSREFWLTASLYALYWIVCIAVAYCSWRYIEIPFLKLRDRHFRQPD